MKLMVFGENDGIRKHIEDLLTSTPHDFRSLDLASILVKGALEGSDGLLVDRDSWQRCVSLFKYFGVLDEINRKPVIVFSRSRKQTPLKNRSPKAYTGFCPLPAQTEDIHAALQQMAQSTVPA